VKPVIMPNPTGLEWLTLDSTATALRFYLSTGWTMAGTSQPGFGGTTRIPMHKGRATTSGITPP
jgi:hypothetical protein